MASSKDVATQLLALIQARGNAEKALGLLLPQYEALEGDGARVATGGSGLLRRALRERRPRSKSTANGKTTSKTDKDSAKQWTLVAAKVAQGVIKTYAVAQDGKTESDVGAALDLGLVALSIVCQNEALLRLGELVVDNMLYQLAKKATETPKCSGMALWMLGALHVRLWVFHNALCDKLNHPQAESPLRHFDDTKKPQDRPTVKDLVQISSFPAPQSYHSLQFTRLLIGVVNIAANLMLAAAQHDDLLLVAKNALGPWIDHLSRIPGVDPKLPASFNDRVFRILWKCAAEIDAKAKKSDDDHSLSVRSAALSFMLKCPNYTRIYCLQQVRRVGVQFDKGIDQGAKSSRYEPLYLFYLTAANLLFGKLPSKSMWKSDAVEWDFVHFLEHFASICESSKRPVEAQIVLQHGIDYASSLPAEGDSIAASFAVMSAGISLDLISQSLPSIKALEEQIKASVFFSRVKNEDLNRIVRRTRCAKQPIKGEGDPWWSLSLNEALHFSSSGSWTDAGLTLVSRSFRRTATKMYQIYSGKQPPQPPEAREAILTSLFLMGEYLARIRESGVKLSDSVADSLATIEARLLRFLVSVLTGNSTTEEEAVSSDSSKLEECILKFQDLLDQALTSTSQPPTRLQIMVGDLQAVARDCYVCATRFYKLQQFNVVVRTLSSTITLVERYLEYVMRSPVAVDPEKVKAAHNSLRAESIASLLAFCLREERDSTMSRKFYGHAVLYASSLETAPSHADKYVTAVLEERRAGRSCDTTALHSSVGSFLKRVRETWCAREGNSAAKDVVRVLCRGFDQAATHILSRMRSKAEEDTKIEAALVRLCCAIDNEAWSVIVEAEGRAIACQNIRHALSGRKCAFAAYYAGGSLSETLGSMRQAVDQLTEVAECLRLSTEPSKASDLGGAIGWRGVIKLEIGQLLGYEGNTVPTDQTKPAIEREDALADIRQCIALWQDCIGGESATNLSSVALFDPFEMTTCLEALCGALSLICCSALETEARLLLTKIRSTDIQERIVISSAPVFLLQPDTISEASQLDTHARDTRMSGSEEIQLQIADAEAGLSLSSIQLDDTTQAREHLTNARTEIQACRATVKLNQDVFVYKSIAMREAVLHMIESDIYVHEGNMEEAISQARAALSICWKLSKKVGAYSTGDDLESNYELPPEVKAALFSRNDDKTSTIAFKALEYSSWDVLLATKLILCRVAALYSFVNQPHRSSAYYSEAMELVGGLNLVGSRRRPFHGFVELQLLAERTTHAAAVHQLLLSDFDDLPRPTSSTPGTRDELGSILQQGDEIMQHGDLQFLESQLDDAVASYTRALKTLHSCSIPSKGLQTALARCYRRTVKVTLRQFDPKLDSSVDDLLSCLKNLKRATKQCADVVEEHFCTCQLVQASLALLRSSSGKGFLPAEKLVKMMENAYNRGDHLGIQHLSREIRLTLGIASLMMIDSLGLTKTRSTDQIEYFSWTAAHALTNYSTVEPRQTANSTYDQVALFSKQIARLPSNWLMVSISIGTGEEMMLSIIQTGGGAPVSFNLGKTPWYDYMIELCGIIESSRKTLFRDPDDDAGAWTSQRKKEWWTTRKELDDGLHQLIEKMQRMLGFWRSLFVYLPQANHLIGQGYASLLYPDEKLLRRNLWLLSAVIASQEALSDKEILRAIDQIAADENRRISSDAAANLLKQIRQAATMDPTATKDAMTDIPATLEQLAKLKVSELRDKLNHHGLDSSGVKADLVERLLHHLTSSSGTPADIPKDDISIILILDHRLEQFPWEGLDVLRQRPVTRMPSMDLVIKNAERHFETAAANKGEASCVAVDVSRVSFLLNPAGDLMSTQQQLQPVLARGESDFGWHGIVGRIPEEDTLRQFLLESDLFVYCGHGSGEKYFHRDKIRSLPGQSAAALLFGCSSGRLEREGVFGPNGAVISYLRAGSATVLAMLWDVTDRDVDLMSVDLLENWLMRPDKPPQSLASALQASRKLCKLQNLNGLAAVCYGLPTIATRLHHRPLKKPRC
ncbi:hypothetical protein Poli38472_013827 [Pythium oligandrum]|uniref:separase n=1 Tax=Pythium oligandrum TaxID=41045 RepID=A0A8K1F9B9_PYTOL|nr:hypothetical protein Poli38472_013827 [Pythium oligandrum]|eukprot:TMW55065.1 hypothetical protein Poli38472_013827 [Pythium oligandrum]